MSNLPDDERAVHLLKNISAPLECGEKQNFYKMLEIMQTHGSSFAQQLAENIIAFIRGTNRDDAVPNEGKVFNCMHTHTVHTYVHAYI